MYKLFLILLTTAGIITAQDVTGEPETVNYVDLNRYSGLWYELARIPNSFQDHCTANTTAYYEIMEDGTIEVINSCEEEDGSIDSARGIAQVTDTLTNSKLEVSFVSILGFNLFWGDYWIIGLGDDYEYALVGTPSRKYGWILSRKNQVSGQFFEKAYAIFEEQGYDRSNFERTLQKP